jgi:tRNA dimethylallyltransferase
MAPQAVGPILAFVVGPTGVGKTDVAIALARRLTAEIVSVDSRQLYRDLDIGTAKPTPAQRRAVRHHLIDLLDPRERCSAGRFLELIAGTLRDLRSRGATALAVGGAGLYVDACLGRFHELPRADEARREIYEAIAREEGPEALHRRLEKVDPQTAGRLAPRDRQRIVRALEVAEGTGFPLSGRFRERTTPLVPPDTPVVYLTRPRKELYARIERRCHAMVAAGLPDEVRRLLEAGLARDAPGMKSVGYAEWIAYALGECDRDLAFDRFVRNSRRYAKRQETWFRNRHPERREVSIPAEEPPERTAERILTDLMRGELPLDRSGEAT